MAAADAASGASDGAYSAITQQAVVVAYHLFRHGAMDRDALARELAELDGDDVEPSVYRDLSPDVNKWLESYRTGNPELADGISLDPAVRAVPLGIWHRRNPTLLIESVLDSARVTHLNGPSAVLAAAVGGAVAGGCFAQNGRDLLMAVLEVAETTRRIIEADEIRYSHTGDIGEVVERLRLATSLVGEPIDSIAHELEDDTIGRASVALAMASSVSADPVARIETAARITGSHGAAIVGAVIGARIGPHRWPWDFPNDTWFVAIGERLVDGIADLAELPVPYAVEQRVSHPARRPAL